MRRFLAVLALVAMSLLVPIELEESELELGAPDPAICFLLGISAAALAFGLWSRQSPGSWAIGSEPRAGPP